MLQWVRANGCERGQETGVERGSHLSVLQWAYSNGCPFDLQRCIDSAWTFASDVVQWCRYRSEMMDAQEGWQA